MDREFNFNPLRSYDIFSISFPYSMEIHQIPTDEENHKGWHFHESFPFFY